MTTAPASASAQAITVSGNQFLVDGQPFVPHGFTSVAPLNSQWCSTSQTAAAAKNFGTAELSTAMNRWNANTLRFQVSQPVLAGSHGAAYAGQVQTDVTAALNAGFIVIVSMQDEASGCGTSEPLPSPQTETAWATLIGSTTLSSDPGVMFEMFNEPDNSTSTTATTNPQQQTWVDWLNGGREIEPTSSQTWTAYTPVGTQALVDYLRGTLNVTNVLIAEGADLGESLQGVPLLTDPGSSYQIAYGVHLYSYTQSVSSWNQNWGYLAATNAVIATEWDYPGSDCGGTQQSMAPQFLSYARNTVNIGVLGWALDVFGGNLMADTALDPTQCGSSSPGSGQVFLSDFMDTFPPAGSVPPTPPLNVAASKPTTTGVTLAWTASTDPAYSQSNLTYDVYRNGLLAGTTAPGVTSFTDTGGSPATSYAYTVTATDPAGYTSSPSPVSTQATLSCPAPAAPAHLTAIAQSPTSVSLSWQAVTPAPGCSITYYSLKRGGTTIASPTATSYLDTSAQPATTYTYTVQAFGSGGVKGPVSAGASVKTPAANPALAVSDADSLGGATYDAVGQPVTFSVTATNTGNENLQGVSVGDGALSGFGCPTSFSGSLVPGASVTCSGVYTVTQADLDNGSYTNHASATSTQTPTAVTAADTIQAAQAPALSLADADSLNGATFSAVGQQVTFSVTATNTGNVTLQGVAVGDGALSGFACPSSFTGSLAPGASVTCSGVYTVTQADVDNGSYTNNASVTSTQTPTAVTAADTIFAAQAPRLSVTDSDSLGGAGYTAVGQQVTFSVTATNSGNTTLRGVSVSDGALSGFGCQMSFSGSLAPGASVTCSGVYTVTQADLDNGSYTNQGTATSTQTPTAVTATDTIQAAQSPALSVTDSDSLGGAEYTAVGQQVTFSVTTTNTGNVTLQGVSVADGALSGFGCPSSFTGTLAPAASVTCSGVYAVTQADLDNGSYTNNASATSTQTPAAVTGSDTVQAAQSPALSVSDADSLAGMLYSEAGQQVTFSVTATNTGNITLQSVTLGDGALSKFGCPSFSGSLAPGASVTCSGVYTVTQADLDNGSYTNQASVTSAQTSTMTATDTIQAAQLPALLVSDADSLSGAEYSAVGQQVTFSVTATNTGNVTLKGVTVGDGALSGFGCPSSFSGSLAPGASVTCSGVYAVAQADLDNGSYTNQASAVSSQTSTMMAADTIYAAQSPALSVADADSLGGATYDAVGQQVTFSVTATNTGNVTLEGVTVADGALSGFGCPSSFSGTLAPGAAVTCSGVYTVTQADLDNGSYTNQASAASSQTPAAVTATDTIQAAQAPALSVADADSLGGAGYTAVGQQVTFSVTATNTGNVTLQGVTVADGALSGFGCPSSFSGSLAPGASVTCSGVYTVTQADLDNGSYTNQASAASSQTATITATDTVEASQSPALAVADADSLAGAKYTAAGQQVTFSVTATNNGNVTLQGVSVADGTLSGFGCPSSFTGSLAPGASVTCTGVYTLKQADLDNGSYTNQASATSTQTPTAVTATDTIQASQNPALSLATSSPTTGYRAAGNVISFKYVATNSGNVTLTGIAITDPKVHASCPSAQLLPGASETCTGSYTVKAADVTAGKVTDTATATGTSPAGAKVTSAASSVTVQALWPASVSGTYSPAAGAAEGFYLGAIGNSWTLLVTHPGTSKVTFTGTITINTGNFTGVTGDPLGKGNSATATGTTLTFTIADTGQVNGFKFTAALPVTAITFTLKVNGTAATAGQIHLGGSASAASTGSPLAFTR